MTQEQVNQAAAICDRMQDSIARLIADFEEIKRASEEFLAKHNQLPEQPK